MDIEEINADRDKFLEAVSANEELAKNVSPELPGAITDSKMGAFVGKVVNTAAAQIAGTASMVSTNRG
mgnify:CR=1 FL=1